MGKNFTKKHRNLNGYLSWVLLSLALVSVLLCGCTKTEPMAGIEDQGEPIEVETQTMEFYVNDFASLLNDEQKDELMLAAATLNEQWHGIQVVVSTIESLKEYSIEEYASSMYNQYGIGTDDMGVLILFSLGEDSNDRNIRVEVGNGLKGYIPESFSKIELIEKYGMTHFENEELAEGLIAVQQAMIEYIKENVPEDWS